MDVHDSARKHGIDNDDIVQAGTEFLIAFSLDEEPPSKELRLGFGRTNMTRKTTKGQPVTDELVEQLAREAESGYDVPALKRRGGRKPLGSSAARVIPVRLDPELEAALKARVDADHTNTSEVIRDALRAWLQSA